MRGEDDGGGCRPFVESSALEVEGKGERPLPEQARTATTLLLFYQYVEPEWTPDEYREALDHAERIAADCHLTGRMRVAREGFNCTLTSEGRSNMHRFCRELRNWKPEVFNRTEFKMTHDLPIKQRFPSLKVIPVAELVHYGLEGEKAPPISRYHGVHLEPRDYHAKLAEPDAVVIDVRCVI